MARNIVADRDLTGTLGFFSIHSTELKETRLDVEGEGSEREVKSQQ